jgi:hypothetical protein
MLNGFPTLISTVQNSYGYTWPFTLQDSAGNTIDLTSASGVTFVCQFAGDNTVQFSNPMTIVTANQGKVSYTVQQTDFPIPGTWNAQFQIAFTGQLMIFSGITIQVDPELPIPPPVT